MGAIAGIAGKLINKAGDATKGIGLNGLVIGGFTLSDYNDKRAEGNGVVSSALLAAGNAFIMNTLGMKTSIALMALEAGSEFAVQGYDSVMEYARSLDRSSRSLPFANSTFVDTQQTYTMRQSGMNLARQSKYNMQQAMMGDEARMVCR